MRGQDGPARNAAIMDGGVYACWLELPASSERKPASQANCSLLNRGCCSDGVTTCSCAKVRYTFGRALVRLLPTRSGQPACWPFTNVCWFDRSVLVECWLLVLFHSVLLLAWRQASCCDRTCSMSQLYAHLQLMCMEQHPVVRVACGVTCTVWCMSCSVVSEPFTVIPLGL